MSTTSILRARLPALPLRELPAALRRLRLLRAEAIFADLSAVYRAEDAARPQPAGYTAEDLAAFVRATGCPASPDERP